MKNQPPALSDFMAAAFGANYWLVGSFRQRKPGARVVSKKEAAEVTAKWRAAWAAATTG
jgi:hypothetical protein